MRQSNLIQNTLGKRGIQDRNDFIDKNINPAKRQKLSDDAFKSNLEDEPPKNL